MVQQVGDVVALSMELLNELGAAVNDNEMYGGFGEDAVAAMVITTLRSAPIVVPSYLRPRA